MRLSAGNKKASHPEQDGELTNTEKEEVLPTDRDAETDPSTPGLRFEEERPQRRTPVQPSGHTDHRRVRLQKLTSWTLPFLGGARHEGRQCSWAGGGEAEGAPGGQV